MFFYLSITFQHLILAAVHPVFYLILHVFDRVQCVLIPNFLIISFLFFIECSHSSLFLDSRAALLSSNCAPPEILDDMQRFIFSPSLFEHAYNEPGSPLTPHESHHPENGTGDSPQSYPLQSSRKEPLKLGGKVRQVPVVQSV